MDFSDLTLFASANYISLYNLHKKPIIMSLREGFHTHQQSFIECPLTIVRTRSSSTQCLSTLILSLTSHFIFSTHTAHMIIRNIDLDSICILTKLHTSTKTNFNQLFQHPKGSDQIKSFFLVRPMVFRVPGSVWRWREMVKREAGS